MRPQGQDLSLTLAAALTESGTDGLLIDKTRPSRIAPLGDALDRGRHRQKPVRSAPARCIASGAAMACGRIRTGRVAQSDAPQDQRWKKLKDGSRA